jgi:hypothetical protein
VFTFPAHPPCRVIGARTLLARVQQKYFFASRLGSGEEAEFPRQSGWSGLLENIVSRPAAKSVKAFCSVGPEERKRCSMHAELHQHWPVLILSTLRFACCQTRCKRLLLASGWQVERLLLRSTPQLCLLRNIFFGKAKEQNMEENVNKKTESRTTTQH